MARSNYLQDCARVGKVCINWEGVSCAGAVTTVGVLCVLGGENEKRQSEKSFKKLVTFRGLEDR